MPDHNPAALDFLLNRRSRPAKTLVAPAPDRAALEVILTAGARTPDHGKLEPWRFIVLEKSALPRLGDLAETRARALGRNDADTQKARGQFDYGQLIVAVIASPVDSPKIPVVEQTYSAGAVCLAVLNAALAAGWGANWLSGWISHDREFVTTGLSLAAHETVAGFIHIGTEGNVPPERPRPDLGAKTTWVSE